MKIQISAIPYAIELTEDTHPAEAGYSKFFIATAGADSPRPVTLKQNGNVWNLYEYSSILSGIRMPVDHQVLPEREREEKRVWD